MMTAPVHSPPKGHEVTSEVAYDLLQDHLETILALLDRPLTRDELLDRIGSEAVLARLLRQGLITEEGNSFHAVASIYSQMRQEGMISFLERYILPSLAASIGEDAGFAALENLQLDLTPEQMAGLRDGQVQGLINELADITDRPANGVVSKLTVLVVGTSRLLPSAEHATLDDGDRALRMLKNACLQRSTPEERELALLTQVDGLVDNDRYAAATDSLRDFTRRIAEQSASSAEAATYHLTVASHWRSATADEQRPRQSC